MKIINIIPGFGGTFYCGNCLRDKGYTETIKKTGHEAFSLPMYLPLSLDQTDNNSDVPVFFGAVNIYLKQNFKLLRNMPKWMERFFNSDFILRFAAKKSGSTRAEGLEDMTISMLLGREGFQKEELQQLIDYLKYHEKPDVVHLSNALLIGIAGKIKEELNIPVVCSLQDEDVWVDAMRDNYRQKVWDIMSEKAKNVDAFIAVSQYFADVMKVKMRIPEEKMNVVYNGVDPLNFTVNIPVLDPPVIGYISRMNEGNGLGILIDAFIELKDNSSYKNAKLRVTGGKTDDDNRFLNKQRRKLKRKGYLEDVEFIYEFSVDILDEFFDKMTLISVPVLNGEAFGLYLLQAMASGIPVVQPGLGAFPEIVKETKGGAIYEPNSPNILAEKWIEIFNNPEELKQMSINGRKAVLNDFNSNQLTNNLISIYEKVTDFEQKNAENN